MLKIDGSDLTHAADRVLKKLAIIYSCGIRC